MYITVHMMDIGFGYTSFNRFCSKFQDYCCNIRFIPLMQIFDFSEGIIVFALLLGEIQFRYASFDFYLQKIYHIFDNFCSSLAKAKITPLCLQIELRLSAEYLSILNIQACISFLKGKNLRLKELIFAFSYLSKFDLAIL